MLVTDQAGREVNVKEVPQRIVSLVPSQTELLFYLGLGEMIKGITLFCERPHDEVKSVKKIGGTKNLKVGDILALEPDLVIANKEENEKEQVEELAKYVPVWVSDVNDLPSALDMIVSVGKITSEENKAFELAEKIEQNFRNLKPDRSLKSLYLIWKNPYMTVGGDTFIHQMMKLSGFENTIAKGKRYPKISEEEIREISPELILLSSEPYPFKEKHIKELKQICPSAKVELVDGQMFSWYGSRLLYAAEYLDDLYKSILSKIK